MPYTNNTPVLNWLALILGGGLTTLVLAAVLNSNLLGFIGSILIGLFGLLMVLLVCGAIIENWRRKK